MEHTMIRGHLPLRADVGVVGLRVLGAVEAPGAGRAVGQGLDPLGGRERPWGAAVLRRVPGPRRAVVTWIQDTGAGVS
jgi:hypothetical protein